MVTKNTNIVFVFFGFERIMKCFFCIDRYFLYVYILFAKRNYKIYN